MCARVRVTPAIVELVTRKFFGFRVQAKYVTSKNFTQAHLRFSSNTSKNWISHLMRKFITWTINCQSLSVFTPMHVSFYARTHGVTFFRNVASIICRSKIEFYFCDLTRQIASCDTPEILLRATLQEKSASACFPIGQVLPKCGVDHIWRRASPPLK